MKIWPFKKKNDLEISVTDANEDVDLESLFSVPAENFLDNITVDSLKKTVTRMLQDEQVFSEYSTFKSFVTSAEHDIDAENETIKEEAAQYLKNIEVQKLLEALDYGSIICEVIWDDPANNAGKWVIKRLKTLDPERYGFNKAGQIVDRENDIVLDQPYKFISVSHDVRNDNPQGNSLLLKAYWPWFFRKTCIRAGMLYTKKAIIPSLVAIYKSAIDQKTTEANGAAIAKKLTALANSSAVAMANVDSVQSINATSKGTDIVNLIELFNRMISKAFLGTSTLTNDSRYSNQGGSDNQVDLIKTRAREIAVNEWQPAINTLLSWTWELNHGVTKDVPFYRFVYDYDPTFEELLNAQNARIPFSLEWFRNKFNIEAPKDDDDSSVKDAQIFSSKVEAGDRFFQRDAKPPKLMTAISRMRRNISED
jgi:hypothetical protein